jgi:hypothetical protein
MIETPQFFADTPDRPPPAAMLACRQLDGIVHEKFSGGREKRCFANNG